MHLVQPAETLDKKMIQIKSAFFTVQRNGTYLAYALKEKGAFIIKLRMCKNLISIPCTAYNESQPRP